jgi:hypothetical protein
VHKGIRAQGHKAGDRRRGKIVACGSCLGGGAVGYLPGGFFGAMRPLYNGPSMGSSITRRI